MTYDDDDPIEAYLDELLVHLRGSPRHVRRVLTETEAHLRDALEAGVGAPEALARFGDAHTVAAAANRQANVPLPILVRQLLLAAAVLAAVGLGAIGVSGFMSAGMDAAFGPRFVAGDLPDITYTPARCSEFRVLAPHAANCAAAAARHHADEVETFRITAGAVGIAIFGAWLALRRRWRATPATGALPKSLVPAVSAAVSVLPRSRSALRRCSRLDGDRPPGSASGSAPRSSLQC
ncbi:MAG: hypothetical protein QOK28_3708 [Actinomycetota bacterium]|jgi:hypothetical protein